jgi:hypothetical protein
MKYLKLYENFNKEVDTRDLLDAILSLSYILEEKGIEIEYWVRQNMNDAVNRYLIGTNDYIRVENSQGEVKEEKDIKFKIEKLEEWDDFPKKIYSYDIAFHTENTNLTDEYFELLKQYLEESFDVNVEKAINWTYKPELRPYNPIIKVFVEKTPDDYGKNGADEDDVNESIDFEKYDGLEPEDIYDMFFDLTDTNTFPESIKLNIDFNNRWLKVGGSIKKPRIENKPIIEVTLKLENIDIPEYGITQAKRQSITDIIKNVKENKVFKNVITIANKRLSEYDWSIDHISDDFGSREIKIVIKKV